MALPRVVYEREVRFAVVMYGGVSLAIYMNGVAQELLHLVRSTASRRPQAGDEPELLGEAEGTDAVYREIAQILGREEGEDPSPDAPVRTRFVIDILSGTSAGGINGIFLGKALTEGLDIAATAKLWVDEGDIGKLINDKDSVGDVDVAQRKPPPSLLNGDRFYRKLYDAFVALGSGPSSGAPLVEVLDLFVTTTDLRGLPVSMKLADSEIWESKHRHVFTFRYESDGRNDFVAPFDPMLAFAARCTSSFPFAFEPVCFGDIAKLLPGVKRGFGEKLPKEWERFFPEYCAQPEATTPVGEQYSQHACDPAARAFGDGGYLDNKPFGYAIDALSTHSNDRPVDRKLLYVEPSPEHPEDERVNPERPDALEAVVTAFTLPRKETIREELKRVLERNRLIERVDGFLNQMDRDLGGGLMMPLPPLSGDGDLGQRLSRYGVSYLSYHRLKVAELCDEITLALVRSAGYARHSSAYTDLRALVTEWRDSAFVRPSRKPEPDGRPSETELLMKYTLSYRIRRLRYVIRLADRLCLDDDALRETLNAVVRNPRTDPTIPWRLDDREFIRGLLPTIVKDVGARRQFRAELRRVRAKLEADLRELVVVCDRVAMLPADSLAGVLDPGEGVAREGRREALGELLDTHWRPQIEKAADRAREGAKELFKGCGVEAEQPLPTEPTQAARWLLWRFHDMFESFDLVSYPILHATDAGVEFSPIDVHRISPEDATSIVDERQKGIHKLAGESFGHFGAFLDEGFRRNDVLWGRLDGAERLISILLADGRYQQDRVRLIRKAHETILAEELGSLDKGTLSDFLVANWRRLGNAPATDESEFETAAKAALRSAQKPADLLAAMKKTYAPPDDVDPELAVRSLARASAVVGLMLEEIGDRRANNAKLGAWVARLGRWFLLLVEAAVPDSLSWHFFRHWRGLLYLFEAFLLLAGAIFAPDVAQLGAMLLVLTGVVHALWLLVGDYMRKRDGVLQALKRVGLFVAVVLALVGAWTVWERLIAPLFIMLGW